MASPDPSNTRAPVMWNRDSATTISSTPDARLWESTNGDSAYTIALYVPGLSGVHATEGLDDPPAGTLPNISPRCTSTPSLSSMTTPYMNGWSISLELDRSAAMRTVYPTWAYSTRSCR